jgi:hypothetical protein
VDGFLEGIDILGRRLSFESQKRPSKFKHDTNFHQNVFMISNLRVEMNPREAMQCNAMQGNAMQCNARQSKKI